jgi:hypothetical protein
MRRSFFRSVIVFALVVVPLLVFSSGPASGQVREPRIEGVSYAEIAEWQSNYGGGPFLRRGYGPGYFMPPPLIMDYCPEDEPPVAKKQKRKNRESSK